MKQFIPELCVATIFIALAIALFNPYWMPMGVQLTTLTAFVLFAVTFAGFIWRENGGDERDVLLRNLSARIAYLAGTAMLVLAITYQIYTTHMPDPWLVATLIVMVLAKTFGFVYTRLTY